MLDDDPLPSMGISISVIRLPSFQLTFIAVVEPNPSGLSWLPSSSSSAGLLAGAGSMR